jgi:antitoxin (DNA-binding transcriptional repressor) of toxin-antitoxin stability system
MNVPLKARRRIHGLAPAKQIVRFALRLRKQDAEGFSQTKTLARSLAGRNRQCTPSACSKRRHLTALLDEVEGGGEVIVTRRGKPIARLAPLETGFNRNRARAGAEGSRAASKGQTLGGVARSPTGRKGAPRWGRGLPPEVRRLFCLRRRREARRLE